MGKFIDTYKDIYDFSHERINAELGILMDYYHAMNQRFDVKNVDLMDDAVRYHERIEKLANMKTKEEEEHTKLVEEII